MKLNTFKKKKLDLNSLVNNQLIKNNLKIKQNKTERIHRITRENIEELPASDLFPSPPIALRFILLQSSLNNIHSNHRFDRALRFREGESAMSWLRSAVHKAVEVGGTGKNNLTRTVRNYADSVVLTAGNAVSEGAKLIQDRIVRNSLISSFPIDSF